MYKPQLHGTRFQRIFSSVISRLSLENLRHARWRMRLIALCLFAFTVQSALASVHLHLSSYGRTTDTVASAFFTADLGDTAAQSDLAKRTGSTDNGNCPLCQFLILGSAAVHSAFVAALAPVESVS